MKLRSQRARFSFVLASFALASLAAVAGACSSSSTTAPSAPIDAGSTTDSSAPVDAGPADAGCSPDLTTDPMNCGRCGRVCEGTCVAGECTPEQLGNPAKPVSAIALGLDAIFFEADGVFTCPKTGCPSRMPTTMLTAANANKGIDVVANGQERVIFTLTDPAAGTISVCDPTGNCVPTALTTSVAAPTRVIAAAGVFFSTDFGLVPDSGAPEGGAAMPDSGAVWTVTATGTAQTPTFVATAHQILGFASAGQTLIWTDALFGVTQYRADAIPAPFFAVTATGVTAAPTGRPATAAGTAYWATTEGAIVTCALASCKDSLTYLLPADPERAIGDVATDGQSLYFAILSTTQKSAPTAASGAVGACTLGVSPCVPELLVANLATPDHVVIDGAWLYWANGSAGDGTTVTAAGTPALFRVAR